MVKISFIASGIILGLATISSASASIISRSFLDQALTDYATTTALDLKANQSDFTDLNTQISDSVDLLRSLLVQGSNSYDLVLANPEKYPNTISGAFSLLYQYLDRFAGSILYGWTDSENKTYLGVKGLDDKIGKLPSGSLINQTPFTDDLYKSTQGTESPVYPNSMAELVKQIYGEFSSSGNQPGLVHLLITGFPHNGGLPINSDFIGILPAMMLAENANSVANTANETAQANTAKIGTLPTEIVIGNSNGSIDMFNITKRQSVSLPKDYTLSDFIQDMYYGSFGVNAGLDSSPFYGLSDIIDHVMYGGITGEASPLTDKQYKGLIDLTLEINKIGDLPTEYATVGAALTAMDAKIGTVPDGKNLAGMISETDAKIGAISPNTTVSDMISKTNAKFGVLPPDTTVAGMIGTLPDEYSTVGAALTAMKSDIDAKNLPSTSDDGQYVLSAKKVGDTITYTWVKMDLTNEEQAQ